MRRTLLVVTILQERRGAVNEHLHGQLEGHGRGQVGQAWVHRIIIVSHLHSISGRAHGLRQAHALHAHALVLIGCLQILHEVTAALRNSQL